MDEAAYKLATWLSPAYPVGAYSHSHGFETAIASGAVRDRATLAAWIADCLRHGAGRNDAILLAHAWRGEDVAALAEALQPSHERAVEAMAMGAAFAAATDAAWNGARPAPYCVAVGEAAAAHAIPLADTVLLYLHAYVANLVSAGVRTVPLGQIEGQKIMAKLMPVCGEVAAEAMAATLDDIGGCAILADIASMRHETQKVRLFRT